jgi:hypothetical protein
VRKTGLQKYSFSFTPQHLQQKIFKKFSSHWFSMSYILKSMENRVKIAPEQRLFGAFCGSHRRRFRSFSEEKGAKRGFWKREETYNE